MAFQHFKKMNTEMRTLVNAFVFCFFVTITYQCYNSGYPHESYLATKTPYRFVCNKSFDKIEYTGCTPKKIWMIVRHGTRLPSADRITEMKIRLPEIRDMILKNTNLPNEYIKNRDLDLFRKWNVKLDEEDDQKLTHEGEEEMLLLAERMQSRFPEVLDPVYSSTSYRFKYTQSQRTEKSAYYFTAGLFGKETAKHVMFPEALKKDPILRFYKLCSKWRYGIKKNESASEELHSFKKGQEVQNTVKEINDRLGLNSMLSTNDIQAMYLTCGFETAWNKGSKSAWCSPFSVDNLKVFEYLEDLKYYWQDGYGYKLSYKQACPAFSDMISFLESKERFPKVSVYFTHSGTLLKLLAHLGLYKDENNLTAGNYKEMRDSRKWRSSQIDSFGTNLAFVSYSCDKDGDKILTMHQEKIVRLPSCADSDLCETSKIKQHYSESINSCDFEAMCEINQEPHSNSDSSSDKSDD